MSADNNLILAITSLILDFIVKLRTGCFSLCVFVAAVVAVSTTSVSFTEARPREIFCCKITFRL